MTEYSVYIQKFGNASSIQSGTQTNEDTFDRICQTDDWWVEDKWVQSTSDMFLESGTCEPVLPWLRPNTSNCNSDIADFVSDKVLVANDSKKLELFLSNSGNVR